MPTKDWNRRPDGTFGPGNDGGGQTKSEVARIMEYVDAATTAVTPAEYAAASRVMLDKALRGDVQAFKALQSLLRIPNVQHLNITNDDAPEILLLWPQLPAGDHGDDEDTADVTVDAQDNDGEDI